jgi:uncharacterized protein (DUF4415 family)
MRFEWDEAKRVANVAKHGVDFTVIVDFEWETALVRPDTREDYGELREVALGLIGARLHAVVFTEHGEVCARQRRKKQGFMPKVIDERARARSCARASLRTVSVKEDAAIRAAAKGDPDNPEWTAKDFRRSRWLAHAKPGFAEAAAQLRGRPRLEHPKVQVTLRLDADVIEAFRSEGKGWQSRINEVLSRAARRRKNAS